MRQEIDYDRRTESDSVRRAGRAARRSGWFACEVDARGYVALKHEAGQLIQRITKGTLRATEAWTDGHAVDEHDELDSEGSGTGHCDGRCRSTFLKITRSQVTDSWHGKHWLMVMRPCRSNDPASALQPLRHPKDARTQRRSSRRGH